MSQNSQPAVRPRLNSAGKMSFAVALCAFAAAGVGLLVNQWMSGWMAVGGMTGVGLFYLAVGLLSLGSTGSIFVEDRDFAETSSHRLSNADNVDDIPVERIPETIDGLQKGRIAEVRS